MKHNFLIALLFLFSANFTIGANILNVDTLGISHDIKMITPSEIINKKIDSLEQTEIDQLISDLVKKNYLGLVNNQQEAAHLFQEVISLFINHNFIVFQYQPYRVVQNHAKDLPSGSMIRESIVSEYSYEGPYIFFQYLLNTSGEIIPFTYVDWNESYPELTNERKKGLEDLLLGVFTKELKGEARRATPATAYAINSFNQLLSSPPKIQLSNSVNSLFFNSLFAKASLTTQLQTFFKAAEQNTNIVVYAYSYNNLLTWFDLNGENASTSNNGVTKLFDDKVHWTTIRDANAEGRYFYSAINENEVNPIFNSGKKLLVIGIAREFLNPDDNFLSHGNSKFYSIYQNQTNPDYYKFVQIQAAQTFIHECYAHGLSYLLGGTTYESKAEEDHKKYHGNYSRGSPGIREVFVYEQNKYKSTTMFSVVKQLLEIYGFEINTLSKYPALPRRE